MSRRPVLLDTCLERVGPIPEWWISRYFGEAVVPQHNNSGLRWPAKKKRNTPWMRRCARPKDAWVAWALWAALRHLKLDSPSKLSRCEVVLRGDRGVGTIDGVTIGFSRRALIQAPLRLGNRQGGWFTPGSTTAEEAEGIGLQLGSRDWTDAEGTMAFAEVSPDPFNMEASSLAAILDIEVRRARGWIEANRMLGLTCLLGPLPRRAFTEGASMRENGELDESGALTKLGWWRLATTASMGIGKAEHYRANRLHPDNRTWYHMRQIQLFAVDKWRQEGWLPVGVEYSEFAWELRRLAHRYRPDALLVTPEGELVWFEYMRRSLLRISASNAYKYRDLVHDYLPFLARLIHRPVRFVHEGPDVHENTLIEIPHLDI